MTMIFQILFMMEWLMLAFEPGNQKVTEVKKQILAKERHVDTPAGSLEVFGIGLSYPNPKFVQEFAKSG